MEQFQKLLDWAKIEELYFRDLCEVFHSTFKLANN